MSGSGMWSSLLSLEPSSQDRFSVIPLANVEDAYLARDSRGCPVVLLQAINQHVTPGMRLRVVSVEHSVDAILHRNGEETSRQLSVIRCVADREDIRRLFVTCIARALPLTSADRRQADVNRVVSQLIDLFATAVKPGKPPAGLWAELLLIARSRDPKRMLRAWHADAADHHDFAEDIERLEVKATSGDGRAHDFSLEQLCPSQEELQITVASMVVMRQDGGVSISRLWSECLTAADNEDALRSKVDRLCVEYLGDGWESAGEYLFDEELALRSLCFFDADDVPQPARPPSSVSHVRFRSDLAGVATLSLEQVSLRSLVAMSDAGTR